MNALKTLKPHWVKALTGVMLVGCLATGGLIAKNLLAGGGDCCKSGAACCKPGAACCHGHGGGGSQAAR